MVVFKAEEIAVKGILESWVLKNYNPSKLLAAICDISEISQVLIRGTSPYKDEKARLVIVISFAMHN